MEDIDWSVSRDNVECERMKTVRVGSEDGPKAAAERMNFKVN